MPTFYILYSFWIKIVFFFINLIKRSVIIPKITSKFQIRLNIAVCWTCLENFVNLFDEMTIYRYIQLKIIFLFQTICHTSNESVEIGNNKKAHIFAIMWYFLLIQLFNAIIMSNTYESINLHLKLYFQMIFLGIENVSVIIQSIQQYSLVYLLSYNLYDISRSANMFCQQTLPNFYSILIKSIPWKK